MTRLARAVVPGILTVALAAAAAPAGAQDYPSRPITIVVPQAPAASSDLLARTLGERAARRLGPAGDHRQPARRRRQRRRRLCGARATRRLHADGRHRRDDDLQRLSLQEHAVRSGEGLRADHQCGRQHHRAHGQFAAAGQLGGGADRLRQGQSRQAPLRLARDRLAASSRPASCLRQKTGIEIVHVPYRGGGPAANDLLGGHINMAFLSLSSAVPHLATGKIKILAVVEKSRYAAMPDIPTVGETVAGFEMSSWLGMFAPAGTPEPLIARLNEGIIRILTAEAVKEKLAGLGLAVAPSHAGRACRHHQGRSRRARPAGEGRQHPGRMTHHGGRDTMRAGGPHAGR